MSKSLKKQVWYKVQHKVQNYVLNQDRLNVWYEVQHKVQNYVLNQVYNQVREQVRAADHE